MPFNTSPINHNPKLSDLFDCLDSTDREHELFARLIKNNTEIKGQLYTPRTDIVGFENIDDLMTEGDDNREKVPLDHDIENGMRKKKVIKSKSKKTKKVSRSY